MSLRHQIRKYWDYFQLFYVLRKFNCLTIYIELNVHLIAKYEIYLRFVRSLDMKLNGLVLTIIITLTAAPLAARGLDAIMETESVPPLQELRILAEEGNKVAQFSLGRSYRTGNGVFQDYGKATVWYLQSAKQGHAPAQHNLALMYEGGQGVAQNSTKAVRWYHLAATQGHTPAQHNLGIIYGFSNGVLLDNVLAHMWFNIASINGQGNATELKNRITSRMSLSSLKKASDMAQDCMRSGYTECGYQPMKYK